MPKPRKLRRITAHDAKEQAVRAKKRQKRRKKSLKHGRPTPAGQGRLREYKRNMG